MLHCAEQVAKKGLKLEKKLNILCGGYEKRQQKLAVRCVRAGQILLETPFARSALQQHLSLDWTLRLGSCDAAVSSADQRCTKDGVHNWRRTGGWAHGSP